MANSSLGSAFQRSPSKVWWGDEVPRASSPESRRDLSSDWRHRHGSGSPNSHKSQDSGFSDSEISPTTACDKTRLQQINQIDTPQTPKRILPPEIIPTDILKDNLYNQESTPKNYKESIKEKYSPKQSISNKLTEESLKKGRIYEKRSQCCRSAPSTPKNHRRQLTLSNGFNSSNERLTLYSPIHRKGTPVNFRNGEKINSCSLKVNRNLFNCYPKDETDFVENENNLETHSLPYISDKVYPDFNATVPLFYEYKFKENHLEEGVSSILEKDIDDNSNVVGSDSFSYQNDELSDCEKEVESFFLDKVEPVHSSTPKVMKILPKKFSLTPFKSLDMVENEEEEIQNRVNPKSESQPPPVEHWLNELEHLTEPECTNTLQSKSIALDLACRVKIITEEIIAPISEMLRHSRIINKEFNQMTDHIETKNSDQLGPLSQSLIGNITEFVLKFITHFQKNGLTNSDQKDLGVQNLLETVQKLQKYTNSTSPDLVKVENLLKTLRENYQCAEFNLLGIEVQSLVNMIEESSALKLRGVLSGITVLALQCEKVSGLVVRTGGPRALLILCVESKASTIRTMALRALATVCCNTAAIRQLEQADGIEIITSILSDSARPEPELAEAISVLAQITAPWIEDNQRVRGLQENLGSLVAAITELLGRTRCCQNLLLCAAALANVTLMNLDCKNAVLENDTVGRLLGAVRGRGPKASVFLKEQTATLIANLSDDSTTQAYLSDKNAAVALLCFLQETPICPEDEAHCNSAQRLQQKAAIALSRLCSDVEVAKQLVELGGVSRLTQLCKDGKERNYSDAVLVACLATLRKIVANCGNDIMDQTDVMELVEPRLLDSFLAYSSQNESYV